MATDELKQEIAFYIYVYKTKLYIFTHIFHHDRCKISYLKWGLCFYEGNNVAVAAAAAAAVFW